MTIRTSAQARGAKAKGRDGENAVVEYLRVRGFNAERRRLSGEADLGDVGGVRGLVVEVKAQRSLALPEWLRELGIEVQNADKKYPEDQPHVGVLVSRRKGKPFAAEWHAVMTLERMVDLLILAGIKP